VPLVTILRTACQLPLHLLDVTFYFKVKLTQTLLQWAGQEHPARLNIRLGRRPYDTPHATVSGHRNLRPDDKEFLGELQTQHLYFTGTSRRHGDRPTPQRTLLGHSSQDKKLL
jgi:hypothetical protein